MTKNKGTFDYNIISAGFYDKILFEENSIRGFWHYQKFDAVSRTLDKTKSGKILDIGCSGGSFLGTLSKEAFSHQVGVDIAIAQIEYAKKYETDFRHFIKIDHVNSLLEKFGEEYFDTITLIEVIEHLEAKEIAEVFSVIFKILKKGGELIITTPNYFSSWPILEIILSKVAYPSYEEQHITKFTFFNFLPKLKTIYPNFSKEFTLEYKSSSHFALFTLAGISSKLAKYLSQAVSVNKWKFPFGALLVTKIRKK